MNDNAPPSKDFSRLRREGHRRGSSFAIGRGFVWARDALASGLVRAGVTPNMLTLAGAVWTVVAAACLLPGAADSWGTAVAAGRWPWPFFAGLALFAASACDMLDGAVARLGALSTPLGAVLDSSLDRLSDMAIYLAIAAHFAWKGNVTYALLAMFALCNATLISYVKARSETLIPDCSVGYWLRGERSAALLIAAFAAHVPAVLWQQALLTAFTVWARLKWTYDVLASQSTGRPAPDAGPLGGWRRYVAPWRFPRGSLPYDLVTGVNIAWILFAPLIWPTIDGSTDPVREFVNRSVG